MPHIQSKVILKNVGPILYGSDCLPIFRRDLFMNFPLPGIHLFTLTAFRNDRPMSVSEELNNLIFVKAIEDCTHSTGGALFDILYSSFSFS